MDTPEPSTKPASTPPIHEYRTQRRVEFADTDMGGIVHFSRFFIFMETAEHELLRSLGTEVHTQLGDRQIGWPRVEATCSYLSPARFAEIIDIHLEVARKGSKSMSYRATFRIGERLVARGGLTSVCCVMNDPAGLKAVEIPDFLASRLAEAPGDTGKL